MRSSTVARIAPLAIFIAALIANRRAATALQQSRAQGDAGQTRTQELQRQMGGLGQLFGLIEGADVAPTTQAAAAVQEAIAALDRTLAAK